MFHSHSNFSLTFYHVNFPFSSSPLDLRPPMPRSHAACNASAVGLIHRTLNLKPRLLTNRSNRNRVRCFQPSKVPCQPTSITLHPVVGKENNPGRITTIASRCINREKRTVVSRNSIGIEPFRSKAPASYDALKPLTQMENTHARSKNGHESHETRGIEPTILGMK